MIKNEVVREVPSGVGNDADIMNESGSGSDRGTVGSSGKTDVGECGDGRRWKKEG